MKVEEIKHCQNIVEYANLEDEACTSIQVHQL